MKKCWSEKVKEAKVPSFFKMCLFEAAARKAVNTSTGVVYKNYLDAGYELARHVGKYVGEDALNRLTRIDGDQVALWMKSYMPRFITLVPSRRRENFVKGFNKFFDDHGYE